MIDPNSNSFWRRKPGGRPSNTKHKILLIFSVLFSSGGQLLMKYGVKSIGGVAFGGGAAAELIRIFTCPYIVIGLFCMGFSLLLWLTIISKLELSFAYPLVAAGYVLILIFGRLFFSESVGAVRITGMACIMAGVILISRTEKKEAAG